jgi:hypothetical protein
MKPKSNTLFHFTKSSETLKQILKNGFWPRYCLEDIKWLGYEEFDYIAYPMACFCDIPLSRISEHIDFYGGFGVGVTRTWAHANGLNPVLYTAGNNHIVNSFRELNEHSDKFKEEEDEELAKTTLRYLLAHAKPTTGTMVVDGKPVEKDFYQESEWRYVPKHQSIRAYLTRHRFEDKETIEEANSLTKENCIIKAGPQDIRYIFVRSDSDIPSIINFLQIELDYLPNSDLKILMSRVVSLESLRVDI